MPEAQLIVTTYDVLRAEYHRTASNMSLRSGAHLDGSLLYRTRWWRIVLDEAQEATHSSRQAIALLKDCEADFRWLSPPCALRLPLPVFVPCC